MQFFSTKKTMLRKVIKIGVILVLYTGTAYAEDLSKPVSSSSSFLTISTNTISSIQSMEIGTKKASLPIPERKPENNIPGIHQLLQFGSLPVPYKKPMPLNNEPISNKNAKIYKKIFEYQNAGQWKQADTLFSQLDDYRLRGHILFQRYMHPTAYRTTFKELIGWLDLYSDHPEAKRIYNLALARMPSDFKGHITKPSGVKGGINIKLDVMYDHGKEYVSSKKRTSSQIKDMRALHKEIRRDLKKGAPTRAYKRLIEDPRAKNLDKVEYDQIRAQIAQSYMFVGKLNKAKELAQASAKRSKNKVALAGWVGGLIAWREGDYKNAAKLFETSANSEFSSPWGVSASAYWASRSYTRIGKIHKVESLLKKSAQYPRTFYGLIATRALGKHFSFNWSMPTFTDEYKEIIRSNPSGYRAMALTLAEQYHLAEKEMRQINPYNNDKLKQALIAYTNHAGLPSFSMRLASAFEHPEGGFYDAALYPEAPWRPENGFKLDKALLFAFIRQESKFNPNARSRSGATGLMQIMPSTASFVTGDKLYKSKAGKYKLQNPQTNIHIGQKYITNLLKQDSVRGDLFSLAIAYNAGPGNLRKWKKSLAEIKDPLLFVESIPMSETRAFVERVLANYWIYRTKMKQPTPSLDYVARGNWAKYVALDGIVRAEANITESPALELQNIKETQRYN
jgi:soluble lytic murein transglycosylase-like protein